MRKSPSNIHHIVYKVPRVLALQHPENPGNRSRVHVSDQFLHAARGRIRRPWRARSTTSSPRVRGDGTRRHVTHRATTPVRPAAVTTWRSRCPDALWSQKRRVRGNFSGRYQWQWLRADVPPAPALAMPWWLIKLISKTAWQVESINQLCNF
jgi:hypothetical protein